MNRYLLAWELFSGLGLTLIGVGCAVYNVGDFPIPWRTGFSAVILLSALGNWFAVYRRLRRRAVQPDAR